MLNRLNGVEENQIQIISVRLVERFVGKSDILLVFVHLYTHILIPRTCVWLRSVMLRNTELRFPPGNLAITVGITFCVQCGRHLPFLEATCFHSNVTFGLLQEARWEGMFSTNGHRKIFHFWSSCEDCFFKTQILWCNIHHEFKTAKASSSIDSTWKIPGCRQH